ncbi:hypothetical protein PanWU01x14_325210 [Parasponia andersonii]|uniref:Uncharacterized protein n=1 Tax=Parasponia andersonii TaxID=3476 RepID=A0A2P5AJV7_PARAD|nr:hypothetical protein PanWU01x14_325210 [Parasponia andersonii]
MEKKVTVTRKSSVVKRKGSSRRSSAPAFCRNPSRKASRPVTWFSSLSCLGIYNGPSLSQTAYAY